METGALMKVSVCKKVKKDTLTKSWQSSINSTRTGQCLTTHSEQGGGSSAVKYGSFMACSEEIRFVGSIVSSFCS